MPGRYILRTISSKNSCRGFFVVIILIMFLILPADNVGAQSDITANMKTVNYSVSGDGTGIRNIKLEPILSFDDVNDIRLGLLYNGYSFNFEGSWLVKFMDDHNHKMNLVIQLGLGIADTSTFKNALGLAGKGYYLTNNRYFWELKYLNGRQRQKWITKGGAALPVSASTDLTLAVGNSIWHPESYLIHMGFAVDL